MKMTPPRSVAHSSNAECVSRVVEIAPAPLLPGEQEADYANLIARIIAVAQPRDAIEEFLTRDVIDLTWEILRLRRLKAGLLRASIGSGVRRVMESLGYDEREGYGSARKLAGLWAAGEKRAQKEVAGALQKGPTHNRRRDGGDA